MSAWSDYDSWEARDRTLLEAAAHARAARLALLMGEPELDWLADPELERVYAGQLSLASPDGYDPDSPDPEPAS